MKVTVSAKGRFHAFDLARELHAHGHLRRLITTYPARIVERFGVPRDKVYTNIGPELFDRAWRKAPVFLRRMFETQLFVSDWADRLAAPNIPDDTEIFVGLSQFSLQSLKRAHSQGAITILERGSTHIVHQRDILQNEYAEYGITGELPDPRIVEKELQEYDTADYISIPSDFVRRTFIDRGIPDSRLIHIPYGVSLESFKPVEKSDDVFRVIHCGALSHRKGVQYLLKAFVELDLPGAELWLIGAVTEEMKPLLARYRRPGIRLLGTFPQADLHKYYSQCSVFCLASIEEGLAMVIPQAMACALPVICTENTGGGDIVREGLDGFIVKAKDVDALKKRILHLYESRETREEMGRSARQRVASGYSWADYGRRMIQAYIKILSTTDSLAAERKRTASSIPS